MSNTPWSDETGRADYFRAAWRDGNAENARLRTELEQVKAERRNLAEYISHIDIDEDICKQIPRCKANVIEGHDCIDCIITVLGRRTRALEVQNEKH